MGINTGNENGVFGGSSRLSFSPTDSDAASGGSSPDESSSSGSLSSGNSGDGGDGGDDGDDDDDKDPGSINKQAQSKESGTGAKQDLDNEVEKIKEKMAKTYVKKKKDKLTNKERVKFDISNSGAHKKLTTKSYAGSSLSTDEPQKEMKDTKDFSQFPQIHQRTIERL